MEYGTEKDRMCVKRYGPDKRKTICPQSAPRPHQQDQRELETHFIIFVLLTCILGLHEVSS